MSLFTTAWRAVTRLLGYTPPESIPVASATAAHEAEVRVTFARQAIDVWLVENENLPGERFVKVADCVGFGHALRAAAGDARQENRTAEYLVCSPIGDRVCKVRVEMLHGTPVMTVVEWIHPALLRMHQRRGQKARAEAGKVAA